MIVTALTLLAVGATDVLRRALTRISPAQRRLAVAPAGLAAVVLGVAVDAWAAGFVAAALAAAWALAVPDDRPSRAGAWPVVVLAVILLLLAALVPARPGMGLVSWPGAALPIDVALLAAGAVVFLVESANLVVRSCLRGDVAGPDDEERSLIPDASPAPQQVMRGGRLIGPLERIIVFSLTLAAAYPLLAAFIAAKGIVRFPEISRDDDRGSRAEYFLVGSLVSWVLALAAAFVVWWAAA